MFHYETEPQGDQVFYHQWFKDVVHDYPFLYLQKMELTELDACHGDTESRLM